MKTRTLGLLHNWTPFSLPFFPCSFLLLCISNSKSISFPVHFRQFMCLVCVGFFSTTEQEFLSLLNRSLAVLQRGKTTNRDRTGETWEEEDGSMTYSHLTHNLPSGLHWDRRNVVCLFAVCKKSPAWGVSWRSFETFHIPSNSDHDSKMLIPCLLIFAYKQDFPKLPIFS